MVQIVQNGQPIANNIVRFAAFNIHNETNTARITLKAGIIQALLWGQTTSKMIGVVLHFRLLIQGKNTFANETRVN